MKIRNMLKDCQPGMALLISAGFKESNDGTRLIWNYDKMSLDLLQRAHNGLKAKNNENDSNSAIEELTNAGFTYEEAMNALNLSKNETENVNNNKDNLRVSSIVLSHIQAYTHHAMNSGAVQIAHSSMNRMLLNVKSAEYQNQTNKKMKNGAVQCVHSQTTQMIYNVKFVEAQISNKPQFQIHRC